MDWGRKKEGKRKDEVQNGFWKSKSLDENECLKSPNVAKVSTRFALFLADSFSALLTVSANSARVDTSLKEIVSVFCMQFIIMSLN